MYQWYLSMLGYMGEELSWKWAAIAGMSLTIALWIVSIGSVVKYIRGSHDWALAMIFSVSSLILSIPMFSFILAWAAMIITPVAALVWSIVQLKRWNLKRIQDNAQRQLIDKQKQDLLNKDYEEVVKMINGEVVPEWADYEKGTIGVRGSIPNPTFLSHLTGIKQEIQQIRQEYNQKRLT